MIGKKGTTFMVVFFIALVAALMLLIYTQREYTVGELPMSAEQVEQEQEYVGNYAEMLKQYTYHAVRYAGFHGSFQAALKGGSLLRPFWVIYSLKIPPPVKDARDAVNDLSKDALSVYSEKVSLEETGKLSFSLEPLSGFGAEADDEGIKAGTFDEGFLVHSSGGKGSVVSDKTSESRVFDNSYSQAVYPLRYWYLYRILRKWIDEQKISQKACRSLPITSLDEIDKIVDEEVKLLNDMFDENVKCEYTIPCKGASSTPLSSADIASLEALAKGKLKDLSLENWEWTIDDCIIDAEPECKPLPFFEASTGASGAPGGDLPAFAGRLLARVSFVVFVTCTDYKYYLPVGPTAPENLKFLIRLHIALLKPTEVLSTAVGGGCCGG